MKIRLLAFFITLSAAFTIKAQYVPIPDPAFVNWLVQNGNASCFNGSQLDTICAASNNSTGFMISNDASIVSISGIRYFKNIKTLLISGCSELTTITDYPYQLKTLEIYGGKLVSLPTMPNSLLSLVVAYNPTFTTLPNTLPASLRSLTLLEDNIGFISSLPDSLNYFESYRNPITSLPALPDSLEVLLVSENQLTSLPPLPSKLKTLDCGTNWITQMPALPHFMQSFNCGSNEITSMVNLPDSVQTCVLSGNANLTCLPIIGYIGNFSFLGTSINCVPNYGNVVQSDPQLSSLPICNLFNSNDCAMLDNIAGIDYFDTNQDCIKNGSEIGVNNLKHLLYKNGTLVAQTYSTIGGYYSFEVNDTGIYEIHVDTFGLGLTVACPTLGMYYNTLTQSDTIFYNNNFGFRCKPGFDVAVSSISSGDLFRPANITTVLVNAGAACADATAGTVTVTINGPASYVSPAVGALTPSTVTGNVITWDVSDFSTVDALHDFNIVIRTDTLAQVGQQVCFTVNVTPTAGDNNPVNNMLTHCFTIVNSYDPNDKAAYPAGNIDTAQEWLTYTVRFQNTGNAAAQHIYVMDTLDTDVEESTFQLLAYSHQPNVQIKDNIVRFNFPNINLPDSVSDEPGSHGYVQYKVKLKDGLPIGTEIKNTAFIYFDFNPPVVTNTTTNTIAEIEDTTIIGIKTVANELSLSVYPNPANQSLTVATNEAGNTIAIFNTQGKLIMKQQMNGSAETLNTAELTGGVYYVEVSGTKGTARRKFIKL